MYIPKRYGETRVDSCPFCSRQALIKNPQGIPVCTDHKNKTLDGFKCSCGSTLDILEGKYGSYFNCFKCGNMNMRKAMELNSHLLNSENKPQAFKVQTSKTSDASKEELIKNKSDKQKSIEARHQIIRSDDPRFFD